MARVTAVIDGVEAGERTAREIADLDTFNRAHPRCHLLRGGLDASFSSREISAIRRCLRGFLRSLSLRGDHVVGLVRTEAGTELHCRFADVVDSQRAGAWFNARNCAQQGYESHRYFLLDPAVREGLRPHGRTALGD